MGFREAQSAFRTRRALDGPQPEKFLGRLPHPVAASFRCCCSALVFPARGLEPYKPVFVAITLGFVGYGYWLVYRQATPCDRGAACAKPLPIQFVRWSLWISTVLVVLALFWNWIAPVIAPIILGL